MLRRLGIDGAHRTARRCRRAFGAATLRSAVVMTSNTGDWRTPYDVSGAVYWGVSSLVQQLIALCLGFALSGSPAVLSVCMALCNHAPVPRSHHDSAPLGTDPYTTTPAADAGSEQALNGAHALCQSAATVTNPASSHPLPNAHTVDGRADCCPDVTLAFATGPDARRTVAKNVRVPPKVPAATLPLTTSALEMLARRPPGLFALPAGATLALRI